MSNLTLIIIDMWWIYLMSIIIGALVVACTRNKRIVTAIVVLNWPSIVGLSAMIYILLFGNSVYDGDLLLLVIFIEFILLLLVTYLLKILFIRIKKKSLLYSADNLLIKLLCINFSIVIYLLISNPASMGIFSEGSRIDYLSNGTIPLLLTYLSTVIQTAIAVAIAVRIYANKLSKLDFIAILALFAASLLAGSKGAVFLAVAMMFVIAWGLGRDFSRLWKIFVPLVALPLVGLYTFILTQFLNTTFNQNINMLFARFVLSADGRALASDYQIRNALMTNIHGTLLSEIFKGFAPRLGFTVSEVPIGVAQYAAEYNITAFVGANAGLGSTILSYYKDSADILSIFICLLFTLVVITVGYLTLLSSTTPFQELFTLAFVMASLLTFVQDYQAFVLTASLLLLWVFYVISRRIIFTSPCHLGLKRFNQL